jgi:hypothetical protein
MSAQRPPLNVACSWTAPITTVSHSSSSISSSQSHSSSSQLSHCFDRTQRRWLASHSCAAGLSQGHPHIALTIRLPASSCQLHRERHSTTPLNPFRRAGFTHVTRGVDDIAASCISRVATAACAEGGGASEGRALGRIPSRCKPSCSQQHHHPIPHLHACSRRYTCTFDAVGLIDVQAWKRDKETAGVRGGCSCNVINPRACTSQVCYRLYCWRSLAASSIRLGDCCGGCWLSTRRVVRCVLEGPGGGCCGGEGGSGGGGGCRRSGG